MAKSKYKIKTVVLRPILDLSEAEQIVENGKTSLFRSMLQKPKKMEVHVHSIKLSYEAFLILSGKYNANFYRKAVHTINVEPTVREIIVGDGVFPIKQGRGVLGKLNYKIKSSTKRKNHVDLELEEHVYLDDEQEVAFDHHGKEIKMPYKMSSRLIESYPRRTLEKTKNNKIGDTDTTVSFFQRVFPPVSCELDMLGEFSAILDAHGNFPGIRIASHPCT